MAWNIYAKTDFNPRHLWLEDIADEQAAWRMANRAVEDNPRVIEMAWVEPGAPEEQRAFHDAVRDMRAARQAA